MLAPSSPIVRSSFQDMYHPEDSKPKAEVVTGFMEILDIARKHKLQTPSRDVCSNIFAREDVMYAEWLNNPLTQRLLLALDCISAELQEQSVNACDNPSESDLRVRTTLAKIKTINEIITYVEKQNQSSVALPRF